MQSFESKRLVNCTNKLFKTTIMKITSYPKKKKFISFFVLLFLLLLSFSIQIFVIKKSAVGYELAILGGIFIVLLFYYKHLYLFEYEDDGLTINIQYNPLLSFSRTRKAEFPKEKLMSYEFKSVFLDKYLIIKVSSSRSKKGYVYLKYNISSLSSKHIQDLQHQLEMI